MVVASEAKQSRLSEKEPKLPTFESDSLKKRWERIFAWWNSRWPLDESTPYERRLAYREMERLVRDPGFEPPPPGWRPPTFEEVVQKFGIAQERR